MTDNEIKFCEYFETTMLPNRRNISMEMLKHCETLLGGSFGIQDCTSCMHRVAVDLMNLYNRLVPFYQEYKNSLIPVEEKPVVVKKTVVVTEPTITKKVNTDGKDKSILNNK